MIYWNDATDARQTWRHRIHCTSYSWSSVLSVGSHSATSYLLLWKHALADRILLPAAPGHVKPRRAVILDTYPSIAHLRPCSRSSIAGRISTDRGKQHNRRATRRLRIEHAYWHRKHDVDRRSRRKLTTATDSNATHATGGRIAELDIGALYVRL